MPQYYLGIDGGQSSTTAFIADETGRIVGHGSGGPCNHVTGPEAGAKFEHEVGNAIEQACSEAGIDASSIVFASCCCGFSGGGEDKEAHARQLIRARKYKITHDAEIALSGATSGEPGIIMIAGTGSMAFGRNAQQVTARAGGWGYIFGDEGGAFDLVRRAVRAALRSEEGWGPRTELRSVLIQATGARDANDLLHRFYTPEFPRTKVAALAPLVSQAAAAGDCVALEIVKKAADDLTCFVQGVYSALFPRSEAVPVAYIGGVFRSSLLLEA
ncbi:MAG: hypothetical protein JOZ62_00855, partial [Acidobacteriaceae bacterium]|nr:hypothetical protein [Acidobacteriaceae bacterium]